MDAEVLKKFQCLRCGKCCMWEGPVRVNEEEIANIASFLSIPLEDFIRDHTVLAPDRKSLSLKEASDVPASIMTGTLMPVFCKV